MMAPMRAGSVALCLGWRDGMGRMASDADSLVAVNHTATHRVRGLTCPSGLGAPSRECWHAQGCPMSGFLFAAAYTLLRAADAALGRGARLRGRPRRGRSSQRGSAPAARAFRCGAVCCWPLVFCAPLSSVIATRLRGWVLDAAPSRFEVCDVVKYLDSYLGRSVADMRWKGLVGKLRDRVRAIATSGALAGLRLRCRGLARCPHCSISGSCVLPRKASM